MSSHASHTGPSSDLFGGVGAISVDESDEYQNDDESADDTPEPKAARRHLPSRPATSSASFRLPTTRPATSQQAAASASFSQRNRTPPAGSPHSPDSPPSTLSRFASFFRTPSFRTTASASSHSIASSAASEPAVAAAAPALWDGMEVVKLDRRGGLSRKRLFLYVDEMSGGGVVTWDSERVKREKAAMVLSECRLECGYHQGWFYNIKGKERARLVNSHCFSLINEKRSLDVICKTQADANAWIAAITPYLPPVTALPPCQGRLMRLCESHIRGGTVSLPTGVSVSPITGQLFVCNTGCDNVLVFDRQGECVAVWGRRGCEDTCFSGPTGVAMGWDEAVCYVCDVGNARVQVMDVRGSLRESWADHDHHSQPVAIAVSPYTHRLYIADQALRCIQVYTSAGEHLSVIQVAERDCVRTGGVAVTGSSDGGDGGQGRDDHVWVSNCQYHRVECYDVASGVWVRSIGSKGAKLGQLFTPRGLAFDVVHRLLYVCDSDNHRVAVWSVDGEEWVLEWGREGPEVCEFVKPHGVAVCPLTGLVTVTDTRNNRVQTFY